MQYTISALSRATGLSLHTLRFYEKEGLLRYVERTAGGRRVYGEASLGCLMGLITLKQAGMTLPQIKALFDETREGAKTQESAETLQSRFNMIIEARDQLQKKLEEITRGLELVNFFVEGGKKALEAARQGKKAADVFPFFTKEGILNMRFSRDSEGKLEAMIPPTAE